MKKLKNKKTSLNMEYNDKKIEGITYKDLINICIDTARIINPETRQEAPISVGEMRQRIKLMDIVDASNGEIQLEDDIYENIKAYVLLRGENGWAVNDKQLIQFEDDYLNVK